MPEEQKVIRKLRAILSADVKGYSLLMADDEVHTIQTLKAYRQIIADFIFEYSGRVVDSPGDNILAEFSSAVDAVKCAAKIQGKLAKENSKFKEEKKVQFRIGINVGDVIQDGDRIYGNGVNVAARIEGLAEPGGICISRNAYDHISDKLNYGYAYLGEHAVKNIKKPVRVYKLMIAPEDAGKLIGDVPKPVAKNWIWATIVVAAVVITAIVFLVYQNVSKPDFEPASVENMVYPLPDKPSIAVLPFDNMSGDPEQEFFSDGISENIITSLSKTDQLFVIARNSSFSYKGKPVNVKQVAEDLGVQYVLEGSVQKSEDRVRITAQLINAISGHHLWAERYDRDLKDIFTLQDEITKKIVTEMGIMLTDGEQFRMQADRTEDLNYLLKLMKAISHLNKSSPEDLKVMGRIGRELVEMEPENPDGYRTLAWYHWVNAAFGISPKENVIKAIKMAKKALSLDESDSQSHSVLGAAYLRARQYDKAIAEGERSVALDPNNTHAHMNFGVTLSYTGRLDEALGHIRQAIRIDPFPTFYSYFNLGRCYFLKKQYGKAFVEYNKAYKLAPNSIPPLISCAAALGMLGREADAREKANKLLEIDPDYSVKKFEQLSLFKNQSDTELFAEGLRKAGIPETTRSSAPEKPSIAVLPFDNLSDDPEQEYFSDGMTDELIGDLAKIKDIFVISRNSTFTYKGKAMKIQQIAEELNVRYILEGSVQRSGNHVRIRAQLIDGKTDHHLWAESYDGTMDDIFALQDKITSKIVSELSVKLTSEEQNRIAGKETHSIEAYEAFLKGQEHYAKFDGKNLMKAIEYYKQAVEIDPNYSRAYSGLAASYTRIATNAFLKQLGISSPLEIYTLVLKGGYYHELAMKNPTFEAYRESAYKANHLRRFDEALAYAEKAVAMAPNEYLAHLALGAILNSIGRAEEALAQFDIAIKLDPRFLDIKLGEKGRAYFVLGDYQKAVEYTQRCLILNPGLNVYASYAAASYAFLDRQKEAEAAWKIFKENFPEGIIPTTKFLYWGFTFKDYKVFDRYIEGLVKAGFEGDPSDYYRVDKEQRLSGDDIREAFYGKTAISFDPWGREAIYSFEKDGKLRVSFPMSGFGDNAKTYIENDQMCFEFDMLFEGLKSCADFYTNSKENDSAGIQYLMLSSIPMRFLKIQE